MEDKQVDDSEQYIENKHLSMLTKWLRTGTSGESTMQVDTIYPDTLVKAIHKPQRERTSFTDKHLKILEDYFIEIKHPDSKCREKLATKLDLPDKTVQVWFQNRRAKERRNEKEKKKLKNVFTKDTSYYYACSKGTDNERVQDPSQIKQDFSKSQLGASTEECSPSCSTVVQVVDSSKNHSNNKEKEDDEEFAIIHIPESLSDMSQREVHNDILNQNRTEVQINSLGFLSSNEMQNMSDSLNLELLIKTYKVLLSSNDANLLIMNWLEVQKSENNGQNPTLENHLEDFINYCENLLH